jgi:hypothetical protein
MLQIDFNTLEEGENYTIDFQKFYYNGIHRIIDTNEEFLNTINYNYYYLGKYKLEDTDWYNDITYYKFTTYLDNKFNELCLFKSNKRASHFNVFINNQDEPIKLDAFTTYDDLLCYSRYTKTCYIYKQEIGPNEFTLK